MANAPSDFKCPRCRNILPVGAGGCFRCSWKKDDAVNPTETWWYPCPRCHGTGPGERPKFCPHCGWEVGRPHTVDAYHLSDSDERPERRRGEIGEGRLIAQVIMLIVIVVGLLYLLNNTHEGLIIKCHVFGDWGACLLSS